MIAWGYLPYTFSEGLCNGKLAYAFKEAGIEMKVISRVDDGHTYDVSWTAPWDKLKPDTVLIDYPLGNKISRLYDAIKSSIVMDGYRDGGVRWARRAYQQALKMLKEERYDAILTRSPNDIAHIIGYKLKQKTGIRWIANWNDPANPIWPGQYRHQYTPKHQQKEMKNTEQLLRSADVNTFPSDSLRLHFVKYFPFLEKHTTVVIPHIGLCSSIFPNAGENFDDGKLRFLHSGNLSIERNPETMFQAFRRIVDSGFYDFEFHIMGPTNEYTLDLIRKYDLTDYVKCIGSFSYMEALSMMQTYDVLILLEARLETGIFFASKFTDYLQTGLPILAISPTKGFAADMLVNQTGEFLSDNQSVDSILFALKEIIERWKDKSLSQCDSKQLFKAVAPETVVALYKAII